MSGVADLYDTCAAWLAVCEAAVATTVGGPIAYAFVSPGPPSVDCAPMLAVHAGGPAEADTLPLIPPLAAGHRDTVQGAVHLVNLTATVIRCAPTLSNEGGLPTIAAQEAAARETHEDVWAVWNWTRATHRAGTLFGGGNHIRELFLDPAFPVVPAGAAAGWSIGIRVQLDGYKP